MSLYEITSRTLHAGAFALAVGAVWIVLRRGNLRQRRERRMLLFVFYLAAVSEIVALRLSCADVPRSVRLFPPLGTVFGQLRQGEWWDFVYHTVGNIIWFVPLGAFVSVLWPKAGWGRVILIGAAFSAALEALQWLLGSGMTDVDDVILNALGALLGRALVLFRKGGK